MGRLAQGCLRHGSKTWGPGVYRVGRLQCGGALDWVDGLSGGRGRPALQSGVSGELPSKASPWSPQPLEGKWAQVMIMHPSAPVSPMCTCPFLHLGRTSELVSKGKEGQESPRHSGSGVPASTNLPLPSSHSRRQGRHQDLLDLPPIPHPSVSEGRAGKGGCCLSLDQGKGPLRQ